MSHSQPDNFTTLPKEPPVNCKDQSRSHRNCANDSGIGSSPPSWGCKSRTKSECTAEQAEVMVAVEPTTSKMSTNGNSTRSKKLGGLRTKAARAKKLRVCEVCKKEFDRPSLLQRHLRVHSKEKPFHCQHCPKSFPTRSSCTSHERIHTGQRLFICEVCDTTFTASSNLTNHKKRKHGKKEDLRHRCSLCDKTFISPSELTRHRRAHGNELPFNCSQCSQGFTTERGLKSHQLTHTKENTVECDPCDNALGGEGALKMEHMPLQPGDFDKAVLLPNSQPDNAQHAKSSARPPDQGIPQLTGMEWYKAAQHHSHSSLPTTRMSSMMDIGTLLQYLPPSQMNHRGLLSLIPKVARGVGQVTQMATPNPHAVHTALPVESRVFSHFDHPTNPPYTTPRMGLSNLLSATPNFAADFTGAVQQSIRPRFTTPHPNFKTVGHASMGLELQPGPCSEEDCVLDLSVRK